ncbi:MAG: MBL fold metallo-hydrolase, partial [Pseudomonadota bacterium]|nr:MBL fold metallo-hydrolase [Pseudomonadota bacterium]
MPTSLQFTRRGLLYGAGMTTVAAAGATLLAPAGALAASAMKGAQVAGWYRFKLGEFEVTVLSDGSYALPTTLIGANVPREQVKAYLASHFLDTEQRLSHVNIPLINTGKELILIDVGGGMNWMPNAGKLSENLKASGYAPEDVDKVILT